MSHPFPRTVLVTLLALLVSCSGKDKDETASAEAAKDADAPVAAKVVEADPDNMSDHVDRLVADAAELPRAEFDPAALAEKLGKDPQAHFEWVRDHTSWAPYRGLLRGAQGVMLDRIGSSLDRAILLGDLLRRSGHTVRLAHTELAGARAAELLTKVRPMPTHGESANAATGASAEALKLIDSQSETLLAAVREAATPNQNSDDAAIAALRDHWWVEREDGGKWIAMDVLLPNGKVGESQAPASSTNRWNAGASAPSIPDSEWHTVRMRVVVERYEAGATSESTVLEKIIRPAEVLGEPLRLIHAPVPWPSGLPAPDKDPQPFKDAALAVKVWVPVLQIGDEMVVHSGYTVEGDLLTNLEEKQNDLAKVSGAVTSGMDMALGGFGAEETTPAATAEWIDYEIRVPGQAVRQLRRPVFDLLGPARRESKSADFEGTADLRKLERFEALWTQTDVLLQPCEFTPEFVAHMTSAGIVANQAGLKKLAGEGDPAKAQKQLYDLLGQIEIWGPLPTLALWRSAVNRQAADAYIGEVNILHYRAGRAVVSGKQEEIRALIDVASNPSAARRGSSQNAFEVSVRQGVADTVAEMLALGNNLAMAANTASVFGRLAAEKSRGMLIAPRDEAAVRALPWPEDEKARVAADVNAGYMVVVPRQAVMLEDQQRVGWWRVDPVTGETVGVMDSGFHGASRSGMVVNIVAAYSLEGKIITIVVGMAPILSNPLVLQRADRIRVAVNHWGSRGVSMPDLRLLAHVDLYRQLIADLSYLAGRMPPP